MSEIEDKNPFWTKRAKRALWISISSIVFYLLATWIFNNHLNSYSFPDYREPTLFVIVCKYIAIASIGTFIVSFFFLFVRYIKRLADRGEIRI